MITYVRKRMIAPLSILAEEAQKNFSRELITSNLIQKKRMNLAVLSLLLIR